MLWRMTLSLVLLGASMSLPGAVCVERAGSRSVKCIELTFDVIGGSWLDLVGMPAVRRVRITLCVANRYRTLTGTNDQTTKSQGSETSDMRCDFSATRY
jgi:hypothetical protein